MPSLYAINRDLIRNLISEKGFKHWWIADSIGVHKTTLRRWLNGRIETIEHKNVIALARILEVQAHTMIVAKKKKAELDPKLFNLYGR